MSRSTCAVVVARSCNARLPSLASRHLPEDSSVFRPAVLKIIRRAQLRSVVYGAGPPATSFSLASSPRESCGDELSCMCVAVRRCASLAVQCYRSCHSSGGVVLVPVLRGVHSDADCGCGHRALHEPSHSKDAVACRCEGRRDARRGRSRAALSRHFRAPCARLVAGRLCVRVCSPRPYRFGIWFLNHVRRTFLSARTPDPRGRARRPSEGEQAQARAPARL